MQKLPEIGEKTQRELPTTYKGAYERSNLSRCPTPEIHILDMREDMRHIYIYGTREPKHVIFKM